MPKHPKDIQEKIEHIDETEKIEHVEETRETEQNTKITRLVDGVEQPETKRKKVQKENKKEEENQNENENENENSTFEKEELSWKDKVFQQGGYCQQCHQSCCGSCDALYTGAVNVAGTLYSTFLCILNILQLIQLSR
jgi:hypothetical protein